MCSRVRDGFWTWLIDASTQNESSRRSKYRASNLHLAPDASGAGKGASFVILSKLKENRQVKSMCRSRSASGIVPLTRVP